MTASRHESRPSLGSDLARVARHVIQRGGYDELPELTDEMLVSGKVDKGGRPRLPNPKRLIAIRLAEGEIRRRRDIGPGWQTQLAEKLAESAAE